MQVTVELVGRDAETARLLELVPACPLVTVTGVGGVGKTALAMHTAAMLEASFGDGVRVCELASEHDPDAIPMLVAGQLGLPSLDAAATAYSDAAVLVVLDNCEHVLDAAAAVALTLLTAGTRVRVLATSREPLALEAERVVAIEPLAVPVTNDLDGVLTSPAAQLFHARATASGSALALDSATAAPIANVCRRLDGLPLALQLAAAWTRVLTPAEIDQHLERRFHLLAARTGRGPQRHRSLRAAIDWSYDVLDDDEQPFFDVLGVFDSHFTVEAARYVADLGDAPLLSVLERLDALVQRSLVTVVPSPLGTRYRLLESLRVYARERLADSGSLEQATDRYVDHLAGVASEIFTSVRASWSPEQLMRLLVEYESLRAATEWCIGHDETPDRAFTLFLPQHLAIDNARARPVAELGQQLLGRWPSPGDRLWPAVAAITAAAVATDGDGDGARQLAERVASMPSDLFGLANACRLLCLLETDAGRPSAALRWAEQARRAASDGGLPPYACELLAFRAQALYHLDRRDEALATAVAMRDEAFGQGSAALVAVSALVRGCVLIGVDDTAAHDLLEDAIEQAKQMRFAWCLGNGLRARGAAALMAGDAATATETLLGSLQVFVSIGDENAVWWTLRWIAALLVATGRRSRAADLLSMLPGQPPPLLLNMLERRFLPGLLGDLTDMPAGSGAMRDAVALARSAVATAVPQRAATTGAPVHGVNQFTLDGEYWTLTFDGRTVRLRDMKGLQDLARLLSRPGREIHCLELMGAQLVEHDTGPTLDAEARHAYEARVVLLRSEIDDAEEARDLARAERARDELDALVEQLTAAAGLAGRSRRPGSSAERARSAVGWRIRAALNRIAQAHPTLGQHLDRSVRTGVWCSYDPAEPIAWEL